MTTGYESWIAPYLERFVALKRAGGAKYCAQERLLKKLDRFLAGVTPPLSNDLLRSFAKRLDHMSPRARDNVVGVVWQALRYAQLHGAPVDRLPPRPASPPSWLRSRPPRIVNEVEINRIMAVARRLTSRKRTEALRGATYATLYGLLWSTGLRISEALALDIGDIDFATGILVVRRGKFDKSRMLPLRRSVLDGLSRYVGDPGRLVAVDEGAPLFVSGRLRRLRADSAGRIFCDLCERAHIAPPRPTLHHLRHSFAVLRVESWYRDDADIHTLLPALSTYLGHRSVQNTRAYLQANGLLLEQACERFTRHTSLLDELPS